MRSLINSITGGTRRGSLAVWRDQDGIAALVVAIFLPVLVAFTALTIDMGYAYWTRTQLQHTATAAALAGASQLADPVDAEAAAKAEAIVYANLNMDPTRFGTTLVDIDVTVGNWDPDCAAIAVGPAARADCFTPMGETGGPGNACDNPQPQETNDNCLIIDAVEATTRTAQANGNPLNLFLSHVIGLAQTDISTSAIAWDGPGGPPPSSDMDNCYQDGMIAGGNVDIQSNNSFNDGYCVYGRCEVSIQSDNIFDTEHQLVINGFPQWLADGVTPVMVPGTQVAVGPIDEASCGAYAASPNPGLDQGGGQNCGLLGADDFCATEFVCGIDAEAGECAWQGPTEGVPAEDLPTPILAEYWTASMFSDIEGLPSLAMSTTDGDMGAITSVDFSAFTGPVSVTKDELTAILADATDSTCQSDQGSVYVVSEDFAITSNVMICNVAIIAPKIDVGSGVTLRDIALIAGDPGNTNNELVVGADISLGSDYNIERVLLASRNRIQLGGSGIMGDPLSCDSAYSPPSVQLFALENVNVGSVTTIYNADIAANGDVNMGSNLAVNLNGTGTTIQANGNIFVASDGTFGACAQDILADANSEGEADSEFTLLRVVN